MKSFGFLQLLCWLLWFLPESTVTGQGNWTWLSGSNTKNQWGVYGVQGVASANNCPGARHRHSMVMHPSGQLIFVFGGSGYDTVGAWGYLNDMWMFNVTSGWWTWISGGNTFHQTGVYGTKGVASVNNCPGARYSHSMVMHPSGQFIFVFGGYGYDTSTTLDRLNDMWMFNMTSGWWTWMSGSNTINQKGIYGTQESLNSCPGARSGHSMVMHPTGQLIYIFGGDGYDATNNIGPLNDMWMFNVTSGSWTWLSGNNTINQAGIYETQGAESLNNCPGARSQHSMVMHSSGQLIFVFGGNGYDTASTPGRLNDMWMFNMTSLLWTWMSGSSTRNQLGIYGTQGIAAVNNRPGARLDHSMVIHSSGQLIFIFGGWGHAAANSGFSNDMWMFNMTSGLWEWMSGSNTTRQTGIYGTQGSTSIINQPGARSGHSMVMHPSEQWLFVFGGDGYDSNTRGYLNDMWIYSGPLFPASAPESQSSVTNLTASVTRLIESSSPIISLTRTNINLPSSVSSLSESQLSVINLTSSVSILLQSSIPLITQTLTNINLPSSVSVVVGPPTQKPNTTIRLKWWLTIGPVYGFLIIFFATWTLFMIGVLAGFMYDERQNRAANRQDTESSSTPADSSSFTDSSFPSSSTKPKSSYGLSKSSDFTTTSSYPPTLVASTNQGTPSHSTNTATSSHRYHPTTTSNTAGLGDPPTLVAPSTKENSSYAQ